MKCFYHSADLDGHCSGAIVNKFYPECEMIGINYGDEFPWSSISHDEIIYMVDFSLQPFDSMVKLAKTTPHFHWIDHHKTAIEEYNNHGVTIHGLRRDGIGACQLVWEYLSGGMDLPQAVKLLAEYDVWNHTDERALPFQYGFRMFKNTLPVNQKLWSIFIEDNTAIDSVVEKGAMIIYYESIQNQKFCKAYAFDTTMPAYPAAQDEITPAYRAIACNKGLTNSQIFDSVWDADKYDLMLTFVRLKMPAKKWTVSMYSTKPEVDCGAIAKRFGGGGHKGAAGFQCETLPFEY